MSSKTRIGVVGAGLRGWNYVRTCLEFGVLGGIYDADEARLATLDGDGTIQTFRNLRSLLDAVDAVAIATPAVSHASLALTTIAAAKHVLVEAPLALTNADAERIADAGKRANVCVAVGSALLYHPAIVAMLNAIKRGTIGRVSHVRARRCNLGGSRDVDNVWWGFPPHDIALAITIFGTAPVRCGAALHATRGRMTDFAYADLNFGGARSAHLEASWLDPQRSASVEVFGSTGVIAFDDTGTACSLTRQPCGVDRRTEASGEALEIMSFANEAPLSGQLRAFIDAIEHGTPLHTSAEAGATVVRVLATLNEIALRTKIDLVAY